MKKIRIFMDMDGSIVDLYSINGYLSKMYEKNFFYDLPAYKNVLQAFIAFAKKYPGIPCSTLSAAMRENPGTVPGKNYWLDHHVPPDLNVKRIFTEYGQPKANFIENGVCSTDFLLDDHSPNLIQWEEYGGSGIKVINQINRQGIKWKKSCIHYLDEPQEIVANIEKIVFEKGTSN